MPDSVYVNVSIDERIMRIGLNRPQKKNAINQAMYEALCCALIEADACDEVRIIVLHGLEECFSAGNDLADFDSREPTGLSGGVTFLLTLHDLKKPLIAAVSGLAVGIGTTLLLHCDLVYAAENTRFRLPFVNLGICPEAASTLLLPAMSGHRAASELLLSGDFFGTETAIKNGLVNQVLPAEKLLDFSLERARQLVNQPVQALTETKRLLKSGSYDTVRQRIMDEAKVFNRLLQSDESRAARRR